MSKYYLVICGLCLLILSGCTYRRLDAPEHRESRPSTYTVSFPMQGSPAGSGEGKISGTVVDEKGRGIFGANVQIDETQQGITVQQIDGSFTMLGVIAGTYTLRVVSLGYTPLIVTDFRVYGEHTSSVYAVLGEAALERVYITNR